jgi:hypothetical protein
MRFIYGIFTGLVTSGLVIIMAQMINEGIFPLPPEIDTSNKMSLGVWMSGLPAKYYLIVSISHAIGAFAAGLISSLVNDSGRMAAGMTALTILFVLVMVYLFTYDFPVWFVITDTVATAILGFTGVIIGSARTVG